MVGSWRRLREKTDNRVIFDRKQGNFGKGVKLNFWVAALGSRRLIWWPVSSHRTSSKFYGTLKMCPVTLHDCQLLDKGTLKKNMAQGKWCPRCNSSKKSRPGRQGVQWWGKQPQPTSLTSLTSCTVALCLCDGPCELPRYYGITYVVLSSNY